MPRKRKQAPPPHGYGNRSDLQATAAAQPVQTPTGGAYGSAGKLAQMQQAVPVPQAGPTAAPALGGGGGAGTPSAAGVSTSTPPVGPGGPQAAIGAAQAFPPINLNFGAPSQIPGEPVTAGMAGGPGAGPPLPPDPLVKAAASLNIMQPGQMDADTARLKAVLNAHLANRGAP